MAKCEGEWETNIKAVPIEKIIIRAPSPSGAFRGTLILNFTGTCKQVTADTEEIEFSLNLGKKIFTFKGTVSTMVSGPNLTDVVSGRCKYTSAAPQAPPNEALDPDSEPVPPPPPPPPVDDDPWDGVKTT